MKSKNRSFLILLFSISLVFGTISASQALPRNIDDDVNAAQQELESASALVREVAAELADIKKQLPIAEAKLKKAREELAVAKEKDRIAAEKLAELENQLQITQKNYEETKSYVADVARSLYQEGPLATINILLGATDPNDFNFLQCFGFSVPENIRTYLLKNCLEISFYNYYKVIENIYYLDGKAYFENIKNTKTYLKHFELIKKTRKSLLGTLAFNEYNTLLESHIKILEEILTDKGHNAKKITTTISKSLSSLESRLLLYGNYYDVPIDIEELSNFRTCLELSVKSYTYYKPFNITEKLKLFFNYGTVLTSIKNCIETYIINKYDFNNVVYVQLKNSSEEDPYSFYILENIVKEKRYWKMDCRLVELSESIINNVRPYLINIFKKIYQDIFNDNDYRENYNSKTEITSSDFEQLLQNIFTLSDTFKFYNIIRTIIKQKAPYYPTENDKFNIVSDDLILKKRFSNTKERVDKADIVKMLFDNITNEQAVDLYRGLCNN